MNKIDEEKLERWSEFFKALSHPLRLKILLTLLEKGEICVKSMCDILETTQSNISQHLSTLKNANIIKYKKKGMLNCYEITDQKVKEILKIITDNG